MKKNSIFIRLMRLCHLLYWLVGIGFRLHSLNRLAPNERRSVLQQMGQSALDVLHVELEKPDTPNNPHGTLIVANHISWLDIFVLAAIYPASFIAAKELRSWFVIGKMIENAGTVFIDRTNRKDIEPINAAIVERLQAGNDVCFFPEARTSLGNAVLPLKAALFQAAINAPTNIQCVVLRYYDAENKRTEQISFSGTNFFITLWRILSQPKITVRIDFPPLIQPTEQPNADRFTLKDQAEALFNQIVLSDSPNPERVLLPEEERSR
ncbi:1-acylglycerol-3-phosphate O-acyltransferase [Simonsiella muelleri]|uniref:lysophospholipid acyltransferase family protein n=1 Tax=Simonsiella muelleri TaxID=72 RepID=UPI0028D69E71|nr:1-acylglycerol-3-phosphate O-acyltransferase [Simonsiella muelleri]